MRHYDLLSPPRMKSKITLSMTRRMGQPMSGRCRSCVELTWFYWFRIQDSPTPYLSEFTNLRWPHLNFHYKRQFLQVAHRGWIVKWRQISSNHVGRDYGWGQAHDQWMRKFPSALWSWLCEPESKHVWLAACPQNVTQTFSNQFSCWEQDRKKKQWKTYSNYQFAQPELWVKTYRHYDICQTHLAQSNGCLSKALP